jgi:hypothetical protein
MRLRENVGNELLHNVHCSLVVLGTNNKVAPTKVGQQRLVARAGIGR